MNANNYLELGKLLRGFKNFRLMPGMLCWRRLPTDELVPTRLVEIEDYATVSDFRVVKRTACEQLNQSAASMVRLGHTVKHGWLLIEDLIPDLSDPATRGCVLQILKECWQDPQFRIFYSSELSGWIWKAKNLCGSCYAAQDIYESEEEAMVDALGLAPLSPTERK